jgi:nucleoid-associated protein YgaU
LPSSTLLRRVAGVVAALALALGIGLATVSPAEASGKTVWDRVAKCESGGRWKINTHNGYYGGLQFSARTWSGFGGKNYASLANKASKAEQIAIARRVLASQGRGAWGSCARKAGLTKKNGKASRHATPSTNPGAKHTKTAKKKATPKATAPRAHKTIHVKAGDTLRKIATRYHVKGGWKGLWQLNKKALTSPDRIYVGQSLRIS